MRLFWRHGFDGVSYQQLMDAMGVTPPTVYAAFGNKARLYEQTLDRYLHTRVGDMAPLTQLGSAREAVENFMRSSARALVDPAGEIGCMINVGMIAAHPDNADLVEDLARRRAVFQTKIEQTLETWLPADRARTASAFVNTVLQGMSVQARDGATIADLDATVDIALAGLSALDYL